MTITKKAIAAAAGVAALSVSTPPASAGHESAYCQINAVSQAAVTGEDMWEGSAQGYASAPEESPMAVRCVVRVNGAIRAATAWGTDWASSVATTMDRVTFVATPTEVVRICAQYQTPHTAAGEVCFATTTEPVQVSGVRAYLLTNL